MPNELLHIRDIVEWQTAIMQPCTSGVEIELRFRRANGTCFVAIDSFPDNRFLQSLAYVNGFMILEYSLAERGWLDDNRFEVRTYETHGVDEAGAIEHFESIRGSIVRWSTEGVKWTPVFGPVIKVD